MSTAKIALREFHSLGLMTEAEVLDVIGDMYGPERKPGVDVLPTHCLSIREGVTVGGALASMHERIEQVLAVNALVATQSDVDSVTGTACMLIDSLLHEVFGLLGLVHSGVGRAVVETGGPA